MKNLIKEKQLKDIIEGIRYIANSGDGASIQLSSKNCKCLSEKIEKLEEEKQKLEKIIIEQDEEQRKLFNHIVKDDYKQRIDKAIEYIEHAQNFGKEKAIYVNGDDLLDILRGE